jgi:hypothetical protein
MVISEKRYSAEAAPSETPIAGSAQGRGCRAASGRPAPRCGGLFAAEAEAHADIRGAAERGKAEDVLIVLVEKVGDVADHAGVRG